VNVVVVDDEPPITALCVKLLEAQGHAVDGYTSPADLLAHLGARPADLLVVDYKMPGMNGVEVMRRARVMRPALRVVMITGHGSPEIVDEAHAAGVDAVLLKPFTAAELTGAVANLAPATT
jgi:two-component system response regulator GlrR